jgi:serine/threonine-protein kinase
MIGKEIFNYRILEKIGEGGMGVVYKAVDTSLDRVVALKALNAELARNPELEQRFRAEAKAQANLNHTNLATLYAFLIQDGTAWMVMEFIDGETFEHMVQRRGPIPHGESVPMFRQALLGIGYAHRMGIVHRDIKPANMMLNNHGIVKVMDFGIAKVMGNRGMTRTGTQMGTAFYMSPEQVTNKPVDIRSDIYSLGVTLYELLTANVPFRGDSEFQIMLAHVNTQPPLPTKFYPYIPKGVENAVLKALQKHPDHRFQTVEEFGHALERPDYVTPQVPAAVDMNPLAQATEVPVPSIPAPKQRLTRKPVLLAAAGGLAAGVLAVVLLRPTPKPIIKGGGGGGGSVIGGGGTGSGSGPVIEIPNGITRAPAAAPHASPPSSTGSVSAGTVPEDIVAVLERWRQSMLSGDVDVQTNCYAPTIELFFRRRNLDRDVLHEMKRSGMATYLDARAYRISDLQLESTSDSRVAVTFNKYWDFYGAKHFYGEEKQRLTFIQVLGDWKIVREEELQIYWYKRE